MRQITSNFFSIDLKKVRSIDFTYFYLNKRKHSRLLLSLNRSHHMLSHFKEAISKHMCR